MVNSSEKKLVTLTSGVSLVHVAMITYVDYQKGSTKLLVKYTILVVNGKNTTAGFGSMATAVAATLVVAVDTAITPVNTSTRTTSNTMIMASLYT